MTAVYMPPECMYPLRAWSPGCVVRHILPCTLTISSIHPQFIAVVALHEASSNAMQGGGLQAHASSRCSQAFTPAAYKLRDRPAQAHHAWHGMAFVAHARWRMFTHSSCNRYPHCWIFPVLRKPTLAGALFLSFMHLAPTYQRPNPPSLHPHTG